MNGSSTRGCLCLLVTIATLADQPVCQPDYRATVAFGDSLTNNDLFGQTTGETKALYGADPMEAVFVKASRPGDRLTVFAVPGVKADAVRAQILAYAWSTVLGQLPMATTFSYEAGSNDVLANIQTLAQYGPGPVTDPIIDAIVLAISGDLGGLALYHPSAHFIIWTIPDLTTVPGLVNGYSATEKANIVACVDRVNGWLRSLRVLPNVAVWDMETLFQQISTNSPVIKERLLRLPPASGAFDAMFADPVHPNAVLNALLADALISELNQRWTLQIPNYTEDELATLARIL